jgi:predicted DNA repair protein MutK/predicted enzyme related to lactoylglutathione lyase
MARVTHFEIHASEPKVLIDFYTALFGWKFAQWHPIEYWLITTGTDDQPGINGGLLPRRGPGPVDGQSVNSFVCTAQVESVDAAVARALTLGGSVAGTSLLALIDDIASVLDDVALMTKVAAKKTAGVLGDDLALNAEQVSGVRAERELPVVWAVAKGSMVNKAILVPAAILITAVAPWAITPLLMLGGAYLCYEGFEKVSHKFLHPNKEEDAAEHDRELTALADPNVDMVAFEKEKIKGAIRTDFILSAEIVVIALGTVQNASFPIQVAVIAGIAVLMTVGVYGLVAGIVKLDDAGLRLGRVAGESASRRLMRATGRAIIFSAPYLMKTLSVVGTAAMFLVGGSIVAHDRRGTGGRAGRSGYIGGCHALASPRTPLQERLAHVRLLLAILIPWLQFFTIGRPIAGIICLLLQITIIGWIPAAIWSVYALSQYKTDEKIGRAVASHESNRHR